MEERSIDRGMGRVVPEQSSLWQVSVFFLVVFLSCSLTPALAADPESPPTQPAAPSVATPEDPSQHQSMTPNCRDEVKKLCRGVRPGGGRIKQCIEENEGKLSPACQKAVQERLDKGGSKKP